MNEIVFLEPNRIDAVPFNAIHGSGYVYVVEYRQGYVKIGRTQNPKQRIEALRTMTPIEITRLAISPVCENYKSIEINLQQIFKNHRIRGEIFSVNFETARDALANCGFAYDKCALIERNRIHSDDLSRFAEEMARKSMEIEIRKYHAQQEEYSSHLREGHLISFKPFAAATDIIVENINGYIGCCIDIGEHGEASEWLEILDGIKSKGVSAYESDIQDYIADMFEAVRGRPSQYLGENGIGFFDAVCEYHDPSL